MSKDACGVEVSVGDTVMLAHTGKSAGIRWSRLHVTRLTEKSFWTEALYDERLWESGPFPLRNCIRV